MKRFATLAAATAAASILGSMPATTAGAVVAGDHTSGSPGLYNPRDQLRAHTGVTCRYSSDGRLHRVSVITPKVKPLSIYTGTHRRSYVLWAAQIQQRSHGHWLTLGKWHKAPEKLLTAKPSWQTLKPLGSVNVAGTKVNGNYRVLERIGWKNYNSHTALVGSVVHVMGAYYYGAKTPVATSCHDRRPTATSFATSVLAGKSLSLDLLAHAKDADRDQLHLTGVSATKNASPISVGAQPNGSITISTDQADAGKTVVVRWVAIDPAGVRSAPATLTVHIRDEVPGPPSSMTVTSVDVPAADHNNGQPTNVEANLTWGAPTTGLPPACYDVRAVRMVSRDSGPFVADPAATINLPCVGGTALHVPQLSPDNEGDPNYVLWQVRAVSKTRLTGTWTSAAVSNAVDETGHSGPDAFQVLRYSGFWINSQTPVAPPTCSQADTVAIQDPKNMPANVGSEIRLTVYDETGC